ncbi:MAG: GIY-YIG nuclease family protein [Acidiferrobacter sp.]
MDVTVRWHKPIPLKSTQGSYVYKGPNLKALEGSGIYVFARGFGKKVVPLYIGRTTSQSLKKRLDQHLDKASFVKSLAGALSGGSLLYIFGTVVPKPGVKIEAALDIIEDTLIQEALAENKELFNQKGTKRAVHTISFTGNGTARTMIDRKAMKTKKA